jgi:hypothetical protein
VITPNDVRKGDVVSCSDGTIAHVLDDKKGIRRQVSIEGDKGTVYVFDWYARISSATATLVESERINMPGEYLKKQARIEVDGIRTGADLEPEPQKLGSLRDAWGGYITLFTPFGGKQTPVPAENDVSGQYPTDASIMFDGERIRKTDLARLMKRPQYGKPQDNRMVSIDSARDLWRAAIDATLTRITPTDGPIDGTQGRKVQLLHSDDKHLCVTVDASRYHLACKVGRVETWQGVEPLRAIVGRDKSGYPTVILMPLRKI